MTRLITFEEADALDGQLRHWAYNSGDAAGTRAVADELLPRLRGRKERAYAFGRAVQNPAFAIGLRGVRVNEARRAKTIADLEAEVEVALATVDAHPIIQAVWDGAEKETGACGKSKRKDGKHTWSKAETEAERTCEQCMAPRFRRSPFNANSSAQAAHLIYDLLKVPPQKNKKGDVSADSEVLERLKLSWGRLAPLAVRKRFRSIEDLIGWESSPRDNIEGAGILNVRALKKQLGEAKAPLTADGRYPTTINIHAAWTGRSSSSKGYMGLGGNMQNKAERMRSMYEADPGYLLVAADLKQAESLQVAYEAEDPAYVEAHQTGDVHTYVTRVLFPEMEWTWDIRQDAKIAKSINPPWDPAPGHDLRFQAKRNTHGYAYGISPAGTARIMHILTRLAAEAHGKLDEAFPGIKQTYQARLRERVRQGLPVVTPLGREIPLLGRPWDQATYRQAYSAGPQATISDLVWLAAYYLYRDFDPHLLQILGNGYDALLFQAREHHIEEAVARVREYMTIPVLMPDGAEMVIPVEISVGKNWGKRSKDNPDGLVEV